MTCVQVQGRQRTQVRWRPPPALLATAAPIKRQFGGRARCARPRAVRGPAVRGQQGRGSCGDKTCAHLPGHRAATASCHLAATIGQWPGLSPGHATTSRAVADPGAWKHLSLIYPALSTSSHICSLLSRHHNKMWVDSKHASTSHSYHLSMLLCI